MNTERNDTASRFGYYGDEPTEGGVRSVEPAKTAGTAEESAAKKTRGATPVGSSEGSKPGIPGPEERLLDISELVRTVGMRYTHRFSLSPYHEGDLDVATPLVGEITLTNAGEVLLLRGHAKTELRMECGRCLNPTLQPVETDLEEEFPLVASRNAFHQEEVVAVDEDTGASVIEANVLNLGELLRQDLLLAAPAQPLCSEECPGIDLSGREGASYLPPTDDEDEAAATPPETEEEANHPLSQLGALLEAKRRAEENGAAG